MTFKEVTAAHRERCYTKVMNSLCGGDREAIINVKVCGTYSNHSA